MPEAEENSLFNMKQAYVKTSKAPLAERMRPKTLSDFAGQKHLLGDGRILRKMIENDCLSSLILWGPPGCGKTTLARIIAEETRSHFIFFSAILTGIKEIRELFLEAEKYSAKGVPTILFVDEIHRFNKTQQDAFLPYVEKGVVTVIGATTENPSFEVVSPLLSRCRVIRLDPLEPEAITAILKKAISDKTDGLGNSGIAIGDDAMDFLASMSDGDARVALNTLEIATMIVAEGNNAAAGNPGSPLSIIAVETVQEAMQRKAPVYDKGGDEHYNLVSAFIKSVRGSDPDAAVYWLARMLEGGEDPLFILRRMIILASEDIGNADPRGIQVAVSALHAFQVTGMPEGRIILGQAATYLATAPKSNASYIAIDSAIEETRKSGALPVPLHLRNAPTRLMKEMGYHDGYRYDHDFENGFSGQECLPEKLRGKKFYIPKGNGYEKNILDRMEWLRRKK